MNNQIAELCFDETDLVGGANVFNDISDAMFAASIVSAGAGAVPTPASAPLLGFAALTGLRGVGANYLSRQVED